LSHEATFRGETVGQVVIVVVDLGNSFVHAGRSRVPNFPSGERDRLVKTVAWLDTVRTLARGAAEVFPLGIESNLVYILSITIYGDLNKE